MNITKIGWRGYSIDCTNPICYIVRTPEGYIRYELGKANSNTQDCIDTINNDIKISQEFKMQA